MFSKNSLRLSFLVLLFPTLGYADFADTDTLQQLDEINVNAEAPAHKVFAAEPKISDKIIDEKELKQRATTIGDALNSELGIHSNQFGGGSSAPIIRGQEGHRIKILQNNNETIDMAAMSPDHAVMVDPSLASSIEILRGASTLLYSSGNVAGLVNVIDQRIPTQLPEKGYSGKINARYGSGNNEKLTTAGFTFALSDHLALRLEGLYKNANDYRIPHSAQKRLADSWADSQVGTVGLSWIDGKNYIGLSYTYRKDQYGLPAHSHEYEHCSADVIWQSSLIYKRYLQLYPHLLEDGDIDYDNPGMSCHTHSFDQNGNYIENTHTHVHGNPWIDLRSKRYDFRAMWHKPLKGLDAISLSAGYVDYHHDEKDGSIATNFFKNKGANVRLEIAHAPLGKLKGVWGLQYLTQHNSALSAVAEGIQQPMLLDNKTKNISAFALEQLEWDNITVEMGARVERQKTNIAYDLEAIQRENYYGAPLPDLSPHKETAYSYSLGFNWRFLPDYVFSILASHQERIPTPQELFAHGKHIATNSFEIGNKHLRKERSNNIEFSLAFVGEKIDYKISTYYNKFDNYIYGKTLNTERGPKSMEYDKDLRLLRYSQAGARFYGIEGEIGYQINANHKATLFGDYVRGKLVHIPPLPGVAEWLSDERPLIPQADRNAPRVPQARLGLRLASQFNEHLNTRLEYYRVFRQNKLSDFERSTQGHHMLNAGLSYQLTYATIDYEFYININNILNEKVYSHASFLSDIPQMGRNMVAGVSIGF